MADITRKYTPVIAVFAVGIISSLLSMMIPQVRIFIWITLGISVIYFVMGWYLFKTYFPDGNSLLLFIMGYLYTSLFMASVFYSAQWPLAGVFIRLTLAWVAIQFLLLSILRKKIPKKGLLQFFIEAGLLLILSILLLAKIL